MPLFVDEDLQLLLACLRDKSLTRAARTLDTTVSTLSRRLNRLEEAAGRTLFLRNTDGLAPTSAALAMRPAAEAAERASLDLAAEVAEGDAEVAGEVRLATTRDMADLVILPQLPALLRAHPRLVLTLEVGAALVDLGRREADLAVRIGTAGDDDRMIARRLRATPLSLFAPASLWGDPPPELRGLPWIGLGDDDTPLSRWLRAQTGRPPSLRVPELPLLRAAMLAGIGVAALPDVYGHLTPGLVEVMQLPLVPATPVFLVGHPTARTTPRVRAVWDFLVDLLGGDPAADQQRLRPALERMYGWRYA